MIAMPVEIAFQSINRHFGVPAQRVVRFDSGNHFRQTLCCHVANPLLGMLEPVLSIRAVRRQARAAVSSAGKLLDQKNKTARLYLLGGGRLDLVPPEIESGTGGAGVITTPAAERPRERRGG